MKRVFLIGLAFICLLGNVNALEISQFSDADGHWAYPALDAAVETGVLTGMNSDTLAPDGAITAAQAVTILDRVLGLEVPQAQPGENWYQPAVQAAAELGISLEETWDPQASMTRIQAFCLLADSFQLSTTQTQALSAFSDTQELSGRESWAAAGLADTGCLEGNQGKLRPNDPITRAEFVTLLYRLTGLEVETGLVQEAWEETFRAYGQDFPAGLILMPSTQSVYLGDVTAQGPVIVRSQDLSTGQLRNTSAPRLVLASGTGNLVIASGEYGSVQVGYGSGKVALSGKITPTVEIFRSDAEVSLQQMELEQLVIAGSHNTIQINHGCQIENLIILEGGQGNHLTIDGTVKSITVLADDTQIQGNGTVERLAVGTQTLQLDLEPQVLLTDTGLRDVALTLDAPDVAAGGSLVATVTAVCPFQEAKTCEAQWYLDGQLVPEYGNDGFQLEDGTVSTFRMALDFSRDMPLSHTVGFTVKYVNTITGKEETITLEETLQVENYPNSYYLEQDRVLASQVSSVYEGDYTMAYDIDYSQEVKEAFINGNGYSSSTGYLIWVNRHTQKVNIFTGSKENWQLLSTYRCATGAPGSTTPTGVTYVTYKQDGWYMGSYNVYWITRFYPNTGYAFHSRGYYPDDRHIAMWPDIGYPMSAGCVRLYDDAAIWIYQNIPVNTTVVIY